MTESALAPEKAAELFDEHAPRAFRYARAMGLSAADADDVVSESFLRVMKSWESYRGQSEFATWLLSIVRNKVIDMMRGESRRTSREDAVGERAARKILPGPDRQAEAREMRDGIAAAMDQLESDQREALALVSAGGLSYKEAARAGGMSVSALTMRVFRARQAVRESLVKRGLLEA